MSEKVEYEVVWNGAKVGPTGTKGELLPPYESKGTLHPNIVQGAGFRTYPNRRTVKEEDGDQS